MAPDSSGAALCALDHKSRRETPLRFLPNPLPALGVASGHRCGPRRFSILVCSSEDVAISIVGSDGNAKSACSLPIPGRLVDVGGYKSIFTALAQGSPPVTGDSGFGDSFITRQKVQPQIAVVHCVCYYDGTGIAQRGKPTVLVPPLFAEELTRAEEELNLLEFTRLDD